ncbi:helix-turn-helix transcriptional regulator [Bacillus ginsengihumi]|uniref:Helix-turn-helix transcriptional regulator n=1 Tax=Heyndrickxia ginsengihumi TaxID=363870 RepID=A0A6M0PB43_9BACI|nr:helix-turn-helix transcriptional regulator [Heyndrickxia ginsengihumi]NEY20528.1 helix-turn-helix transcriptional regulator [Heyndrickxia ginsengihumi]
MKQRRDKLVLLRKSKEYLQKDVVDILDKKYNIIISDSYYGMIEQGKRTPSLTVALAISDIFQADPNEIFFGKKQQNVVLRR